MTAAEMYRRDSSGVVEALGIDVGAILFYLVVVVLFLGFILPIFLRRTALDTLNNSSDYKERVGAAERLALSDPGETKQVDLGGGEILEITYYLSANEFLRVKKKMQVTE